jgi:hypothetical protein
LLEKPEHNLRKALLNATWKDILLVPQAWYPDHTPKYETQGWWYVSAEEVLGRTCKSCNAFRALADFTGNKRKKTVPGICFRCKSEDDRASTQRGSGPTKTGPRKRIALIPEGSIRRRSARAQGLERVKYHECVESEPRYITHGDDKDQGDMILTLAQVRELILVVNTGPFIKILLHNHSVNIK